MDGVFAANDAHAIGFMSGLRAAGLLRNGPASGQPVALIGLGDLEMGRLIAPSLSTIRVHGDAIAFAGFELERDEDLGGGHEGPGLGRRVQPAHDEAPGSAADRRVRMGGPGDAVRDPVDKQVHRQGDRLLPAGDDPVLPLGRGWGAAAPEAQP